MSEAPPLVKAPATWTMGVVEVGVSVSPFQSNAMRASCIFFAEIVVTFNRRSVWSKVWLS